MRLKTDFDFFPALRDISCTPEMIALKTRNWRRLEQAKRTDGNVYRVHPWHDAIMNELKRRFG